MWNSSPPFSPPPQILTMGEVIANKAEAFAMANVYSGPKKSGDHLFGWPLTDLINAVAPSASPLEKSQALFELRKSYSSVSAAHGIGSTAPIVHPYSLEERLAMRMHWGRPEAGGTHSGFEHVAIYNIASTTVHVWIISKSGQSVVLEDEAPLFPSDALITKLNMLKE